MRVSFYLVLATILSANAAPHQKRRLNYFNDYENESLTLQLNKEDVQQAMADNPMVTKQGFSQGAGLRAIAQGSADQANMAVENQNAAAKQAAFVAKNTLAQAAAQASATAQAALAGKQIIAQGIEQQFRDAKVALDGETQQLMQAQRAADASQQAAQQTLQQVNVIQAALNAAQVASDHASQAASETAGELAAQRAMVGSAQQRLKTLGEQLIGVRIDFIATQQAANKAMMAAQAAQAAAAEAAAVAQLAQPTLPPPTPKEKNMLIDADEY